MLPENTPQFENGVVTLPSVTGVTWRVDCETRRAGKLAKLKPGDEVHVEAKAKHGYHIQGDREWVFSVPKESDPK